MNRITKFGRGKDKKPRKRSFRRLRQGISEVGSIAGNTAMQGLTGAGLLGTAGLVASPQNAQLQGRLARAGLVAGAGYGLYQGIKALKAKQRKRRLFR